MIYVTNAFSINMLTQSAEEISFIRTTVEMIKSILNDNIFESGVGHTDTATVFSNILGVEIPADRSTISLRPEDTLVVGQYKGPRLPEGAKKLPEGATIQWWIVEKMLMVDEDGRTVPIH